MWEVAKNVGGTTIGHYEVDSGGDASVTFGSTSGDSRIAQTYDHLVLKGSSRFDNSGQAYAYEWDGVRLNGDTGSNYRYQYLYGESTSTESGGASTYSSMFMYTAGYGARTGVFGNWTMWIPMYTSDKYKQIIGDASVGTGYNNSGNNGSITAYTSYSWENTAAITQIAIGPPGAGGSDYVEHTCFTLYGLTMS